MQRLLSELRRRNVFRVAGAYLVMAWLIMQVASVLESGLGLPAWFDAVVIGFVSLGFPVAILLAWAFEMTPEGMRKTSAADGDVEFRPLGPTDYVLMGLLVLVVGFMGVQLVTGTDRETSPTQTAEAADSAAISGAENADGATPSAIPVQASIAVLPFADMSPDGDQQYFSDGIAEELLNALAQFPDLRVAARTSAFAFREETDLREVGSALGVAHVLEGSVRRSGERVRITAQLIRASDGFHVWSETYDRTLTDIFAVQDEIVAELSRVLQVRLGVGFGEGRAASANIDPNAYEQYLRGLGLWAERIDQDKRWEAAESFRRATEMAPDFADAWASYGIALVGSDFRNRGIPDTVGKDRAFDAFARALEINPETARAHSGLSTYYAYVSLDMRLALEHGQRAVELAPNATHSNYFYSLTLFRSGDFDSAMTAADRALTIDPLNEVPLFFITMELAANGLAEFARQRLTQCGQCDEFSQLHLTRRATNHNGSEADVRAAADALNDFFRTQDDGTPESRLAIETDVRFFTDLTDVLLGIEGAGSLFSANLNDAFADTEDATLLARLGEDDRAINILFNLHETRVAYELEYILTPGRYEFPERTRRHPRYHEFWSQPGMAEWAEIRRANGQIAGLPLPMEPAE